MNIEFTKQALADIQSIRSYIYQNNPDYADKTIGRILQLIRTISSFPFIGRKGSKENTRELSIAGLPYFIVYDSPEPTTVRILNILHERREYP